MSIYDKDMFGHSKNDGMVPALVDSPSVVIENDAMIEMSDPNANGDSLPIQKEVRCLDLFCCAGGAAMGLHRAGFDVTGVDITLQPRYPFRFIQGDALAQDLTGYDFVWASPPCQGYSRAKGLSMARNNGLYGTHEILIDKVRDMLIDWGGPWVIENVAGAPLRNPLRLYGSQFGLLTQRQRWFESNFPLTPPDKPMRRMKTKSAGNGIGPDGSISICGSGGVRGLNAKQIPVYWSKALGGVEWMNRSEMAECIPPAYSEFIGKQAMDWITMNRRNSRSGE